MSIEVAQMDAVDRLSVAIRRLERWKGIGRALIENHPSAEAADGITCLDIWRKEAAELLEEKD